jgi:chromosomal replication initiator protein
MNNIIKGDKVFIAKLEAVIYEYTGINADVIKSKTRKTEIVTIRFIQAWLMKKYTFMSLCSIGKHMGGRDHSTIIHVLKTIEDWYEQPKMFAPELKMLEAIEREVKI